MARKLIVEVVGDTSQFERSMKRSSVAASRFERDVSKMGRGVAAGSGLFRGFGRSIAFASGGFLAFESLSGFLRASIDAARDAGVAQRSLAAQMKASGESFDQNRGQVEHAARSYAKFGFQNDEVIQSLTVLERGTGNINKALRLQTLTADLARARNIRLADAAGIVAKVFGGQETALRRAVPGLRRNAHGLDLIRQASQRLAGQAAANTTSADRFAASLHDTEEIIGQALLPILNKYLDKLSTWLEDTNNQKKLQDDLNTTVSDGAAAMHGLAVGLGAVKSAWDKLPDFGKHQGLAGILGIGPGHRIPKGPSLLDLLGGGGKDKATGDIFQGIEKTVTNALDGITAAVERAVGKVNAAVRSLQGRFNIQELKLAQAGLTKTLADDRRVLVVEKAIVEQQIKSAKTLKDKTKFTQQLVGINNQILSIDQQQTQAAKEKSQALKDQADAIKSAILDQLQARQTANRDKQAIQDATAQLRTARALGGPVGIRLAERGLTDAQLQARIDRLQQLPARLTRGGQFSLGNQITVNVHGVTDPAKVAKAVVAEIRRAERHHSPQSRGASPTGAPR